MANRAYLFATDNENYRLDRDKIPYYDSRWNIPLLWFLFFEENSIKTRTATVYDQPDKPWNETILIDRKNAAIERFVKSLPNLDRLFSLPNIDIEKFVGGIENWQGNSLILDPCEIIQDEGEKPDSKTLNEFSRALKLLANEETEKAVQILDIYAGEFKVVGETASNFTNYFIGYTYQ
jgi:hypothetical protein